jgi:hypothetical protein
MEPVLNQSIDYEGRLFPMAGTWYASMSRFCRNGVGLGFAGLGHLFTRLFRLHLMIVLL